MGRALWFQEQRAGPGRAGVAGWLQGASGSTMYSRAYQ